MHIGCTVDEVICQNDVLLKYNKHVTVYYFQQGNAYVGTFQLGKRGFTHSSETLLAVIIFRCVYVLEQKKKRFVRTSVYKLTVTVASESIIPFRNASEFLTTLSMTSNLAPVESNHRTDSVAPRLTATISGVSICALPRNGIYKVDKI